MLKNASDYERQIKIECVWNYDLPRNKYYVFNHNNSIQLYKNNEYVEIVSVDKTNDSLIGFMRFNKRNNCAANIETINFYPEKQNIFSVDLMRFLKQIFTKHKLDMAQFSINKFNEKYESEKTFVENWGGSKIEKDNTNWAFFEVTKEAFFSRISNTRKTKTKGAL